jgi:DNA-binding IclR family transcriptional regulator
VNARAGGVMVKPQAPRRPRAPAPVAARRVGVTRNVPAVSRAIAILRLLAKSEAPLGVHAVANALDLVPSTALHILRALVAEEIVTFDPKTKRYALGAGILSIARSVLRRRSLGDIAQAPLDALARRFGATAVCVQAAGLKHIVVVAISRMEQALRLRVEIGSRFPALISATGRCLAASGDYEPGELKRRFDALRWDHPPNFATWLDEVEKARVAGYAVDDGQYISGVAIIAAPVPAEGGVKNALVMIGVAESLRRAGFAAIGEALGGEAIELSRRLEAAL